MLDSVLDSYTLLDSQETLLNSQENMRKQQPSKNGINTAKKQILLQKFKNHPVYPIVLETKEHYVKIKVLIFTCSYVSSEPIGSREKLTDLDCIMLAFVNMMFNINAAMGSDYINILNLFSCYDSANSHSKSIGDNYNVVKELGSISPSTNYLSGNFKSKSRALLGAWS